MIDFQRLRYNEGTEKVIAVRYDPCRRVLGRACFVCSTRLWGAAEGSGAARYGEGQEKSLLYNCLKGGCSKESVRLLPRVMR